MSDFEAELRRLSLQTAQLILEEQREKLRKATFEADRAEAEMRFTREYIKHNKPERFI